MIFDPSNINPVALHIGFINIRWYGVIIASGLVLGTLMAGFIAKQLRENPEHAWNIVTYGAVFAIICARLYYVAFTWDVYSNHPEDIIAIWKGGLAIHGGILGGIVFLLIYAHLNKLNKLLWLDIAVFGMIIGQSIGRWGNFINQEAFGGPNPDGIFKLFVSQIYRPVEYSSEMYFHPTFFYESMWDIGVLGIMIFIFFKYRDKLKAGTFLAIYGILYPAGRFWIEGLRTDSLMLTPYIKQAQVFSAALVVISIIMLILIYRDKFLKSKPASNP